MRPKSSYGSELGAAGSIGAFLRGPGEAPPVGSSGDVDPMMRTLRAIPDGGGALPEILRAAGLSLQAVNDALKELEASRLIRREEATDRIRFTLTPDGAALRDDLPGGGPSA